MRTGNPDIREEVEGNRGILKEIQLIVPFFHGYRKLEDIRVADELLRKQASSIIQQALDALENEKSTLVNQGSFDKLTLIGSAMSRLQEFQGEMLHAQQGSTGISPAIRLDLTKLDKLYEYDLKFLKVSTNLKDLANIGGTGDLASSLGKLTQEVENARSAWQARIQAVENILLTPGGGK